MMSAAGFLGGLAEIMDLVAAGRYVAAPGVATTAAFVQFLIDTTARTLWWDRDGAGSVAAVLVVDLAGAQGWEGAEIRVVA